MVDCMNLFDRDSVVEDFFETDSVDLNNVEFVSNSDNYDELSSSVNSLNHRVSDFSLPSSASTVHDNHSTTRTSRSQGQVEGYLGG